jgi:DNA polymerase III alpha subunit
LEVANGVQVGIVATNDVHYATAEGYRLHDILTATRHNVSVSELGPRRRPNNEFHLKGEAEMASLFADLPEALNAAADIAARCNVSLDFSRRRFPAFALGPGETAFDRLFDLCQACV